jgi:hypothetical protein
LTIIFASCKTKKVECISIDSEKLLIVNKAIHDYGGLNEILLDDIKEISKICRQLNELSTELQNVEVNDNNGFIEIIKKKEKEKDSSLLDIIFSNSDGIVIRYIGLYYRNKVLAETVFKHLKLNQDLIPKHRNKSIQDKTIKNDTLVKKRKLIKKVGEFGIENGSN